MEADKWKPAVNGSGKLNWFVYRGEQPMEVLSDKRGRYRRFGSHEKARVAALWANQGA